MVFQSCRFRFRVKAIDLAISGVMSLSRFDHCTKPGSFTSAFEPADRVNVNAEVSINEVACHEGIYKIC